MNSLRVTKTPIAGLLVVDLPLHGDNRGWFKEHWQREKMTALGLPDFGPVQQNISFNAAAGTTRGLHAEPWDKYVSVASGRAFGAWVDLREGDAFGTKFSIELTPSRAVFVPRGVANGFQTLEQNTTYMYLVNDHWSERANYSFLNLADPTVSIEWPIPLEDATVSGKDLEHPFLADVAPVPPKKTVVLGANGQLGRALRAVLPESSTCFLTRAEVDLADSESIDAYDWENVGTIINAAAYTAVDSAESPKGRALAWQVNAVAVEKLAKIARSKSATLVSISSDYVFDGEKFPHLEEEQIAPLGVYGQSKAAGELAATQVPRHYVIRTSWVIGDGDNFVRTMARLASEGVNPEVINDQHGRLTFAENLAEGIQHLIMQNSASGIYNLSCSGETMTWYDVARSVFSTLGFDPNRVTPISSAAYNAKQRGSGKQVAPRPRLSTFDLHKIEETGFDPIDGEVALREYVTKLTRLSA